ncbi:MAG: cell wall-binding repeat-containing protein [Tissierellia bacterium]|nr:cell wall-binding repeat-containing protein [Tissierellia bacterium]
MSRRVFSSLLVVALLFTSIPALASDDNNSAVVSTEKANEDPVPTSDQDQVGESPLLKGQSGETKVGIAITVHSGSIQITKDAVLTYQREDKSYAEFTAIESAARPGVYFFEVTPDEKGVWKVVLYNGQPFVEPRLDLIAFDTEEELQAYFDQKEKYEVTRISGDNRYETAMQGSEMISQAGIAVIASGDNFADALFGGPLASEVSGPMLLTSKDHLPTGMADVLKSLGVKLIYLLGGENTISEKVVAELEDLGYGVTRIAGENRVETAARINKEAATLRGIKVLGDTPSIFVSGSDFADALSAAPYAFLLQKSAGYGRFVPYTDFLYERDLVIGGRNSVPGEGEKERIAGDNRYETALKVADAHKALLKENKDIDLKKVIIVDGTSYPDALAAGPCATYTNAVILLTSPNKLSPGIAEFIEENEIHRVTIIGGENSVSEEVEKELRELR